MADVLLLTFAAIFLAALSLVVVRDGSCCCGGLACCTPSAWPFALVDVGSWDFLPETLTPCGDQCEAWDDTVYVVPMAVDGLACIGSVSGELGACPGLPGQLTYVVRVEIQPAGVGFKTWTLFIQFTHLSAGNFSYSYVSAPFPEDECREPRLVEFDATGSSGVPPCSGPASPSRRPASILITPSLT